MVLLAHHLPALQIIVPLIAAIIAFVAPTRAAWTIAFVAALVSLAISIALFNMVYDGNIVSYHLSGWAPPIGIEYRVDILNGFVLLILNFMAAMALLYAERSVAFEIPQKLHSIFYALFLLCLTGLGGVTITGDIFNLFIFLEISSLASCGLIAAGANRDRRALTAAYNYLIVGSIGASFFVMGIGFLYAASGTLNLADLAQELIRHGDSRLLRTGFALVLISLGIKLAIYPLHMWLPNVYRFAPSAVSAFIAATGTKVAFYALLRILFMVFGFDQPFETSAMRLVVLPLALVAMFAASYAAFRQDDLKRLLAYSSIAQIGTMLLGLAMLSHTGLVAAIIHIFNHALVKGAMFMAAGCYVFSTGTTSLNALKGVGRDMPWTSAAFVAGGLNLIGMPLTAGFVSKWYLIQAALGADSWILAFLIVLSSLLTALYVWRFIDTAYIAPVPEGGARTEAPASLLIPLWSLIGLSFYFGIDASLTSAAASRAANALIGMSSLFWQ